MAFCGTIAMALVSAIESNKAIEVLHAYAWSWHVSPPARRVEESKLGASIQSWTSMKRDLQVRSRGESPQVVNQTWCSVFLVYGKLPGQFCEKERSICVGNPG
eukprot:3150304-Amphidinium_carterae.3